MSDPRLDDLREHVAMADWAPVMKVAGYVPMSAEMQADLVTVTAWVWTPDTRTPEERAADIRRWEAERPQRVRANIRRNLDDVKPRNKRAGQFVRAA